jgi:hypothetical protein
VGRLVAVGDRSPPAGPGDCRYGDGVTAADVNENDPVVALYKALRPIASDLGVAIILLHHERKQQVGQTRDRSQAMLGARQWAGQADRQLTVRVNGHLEVTDRPDGGAG